MHRNWQLYIQEYVEELFSGDFTGIPPYMYTLQWALFAALVPTMHSQKECSIVKYRAHLGTSAANILQATLYM